MLEQKHNEEQTADAANSQPAYCKTDVTCIPSVNTNPETSFDLSKYGFILSRGGNGDAEFYRREFDDIAVELLVSAGTYTLSIDQGDYKLEIASRYDVENINQLEFLLFNGRVGAWFRP